MVFESWAQATAMRYLLPEFRTWRARSSSFVIIHFSIGLAGCSCEYDTIVLGLLGIGS